MEHLYLHPTPTSISINSIFISTLRFYQLFQASSFASFWFVYLYKVDIFSSLLHHGLLRDSNIILWFLYLTLTHSRSSRYIWFWEKDSTHQTYPQCHCSGQVSHIISFNPCDLLTLSLSLWSSRTSLFLMPWVCKLVQPLTLALAVHLPGFLSPPDPPMVGIFSPFLFKLKSYLLWESHPDHCSQGTQPSPHTGLFYIPMSLLEKVMATHSSTLAWKIPWAEEPGGLQSMGLWRVRHDWATLLSLFTFMHWRRKWHPTPVLLPGESQGRGSLVGCRYGVAQSRTWLKWLSSSSSSQYSCLENPRDGGAWWVAAYGVAQSQTWLKWLSSNVPFHSPHNIY